MNIEALAQQLGCGLVSQVREPVRHAIPDDPAEAAEMLRMVKATRARNSLAEFVRQGWAVLHPSTPLDWNWHLDAIASHVQAMIEELLRARRDPSYVMRDQNLLINIPPRQLKTEILQIFAPAWAWLHDPSITIRCLSGNARVIALASQDCRSLIGSEWYRTTFEIPWEITGDSDAIGLFKNTARGRRHAGTFLADITGEGTDIIIVDDPHDAEGANSEAKRQKVRDRWTLAIESRVSDNNRCLRLGIMQRLHELDWSQLVLESWRHLNIPMEFETQRGCICRDCLAGETLTGWIDPRREEGELLHPERWPRDKLEQRKKVLGSMGYAGQMQQRPAPAEGGLFKRAWWSWYQAPGNITRPRPMGCNEKPAIPAPTFDRILISVDCAFKKTDEGSRVSALVIGGRGPDRFVLDNRTAPMDFIETCNMVRDLRKRYPKALKILIEDKANGPAVVNTLTKEISGVIEIQPEGGKEARASAISPSVESGNVYLPDGAPWLDDFVNELATFPNGAKDDQVDALSQALIYMGGSVDAYRASLLGTF